MANDENETKMSLDLSELDQVAGGAESKYDTFNGQYTCARCGWYWPVSDGFSCPNCEGTPMRNYHTSN